MAWHNYIENGEMMEKVERLKRELVHKGKIIDIYCDTVKIPKNGNIAKWDFIGHKGAAAVVPVTKEGKIIMVKQYRNALDRETIEIPAGGRENENEPMIEAAKRELEEETGYRSENLDLLISLYTTVAFCNERIDVFVAKDLVRTEQNFDEDEEIELMEFTVEELCEMIYSCKIQDSKTIAAIMAYKNKYCI